MNYHLTSLTDKDRADYPKSLLHEINILEKKKATFTVSDYMLQKIKSGDIRLIEGFIPLEEGIYTADFSYHKGKSPLDSRSENKNDATHTYCSLLQFLRLIQEYPELCEENLYLNFSADEVRDGAGGWTCVPCCYEDGGGLWLDGGWSGSAIPCYAGCTFLSGVAGESTIEPSSSETLKFDISISEITVNGRVYRLVEEQE